jgi:uncharacterized protein YbjT (DUF2867 family)
MMILVTGATGFVGRSLTNGLTLAGYTWRAYSGRINSPQSLREQLQGIDVVFHLAGSEWRGSGRLLRHVDVDGTARLLEEARRAGVGYLVAPSRLNADPHSLHPLLRAKGEVERLVAGGGIPYTIVRGSSLFGLHDRFTEIILALALWSWPFVWLPGGGKAVMQPLWVEDYARCLLACLERPDLRNKVVTVAGEEQFRYRALVDQILAATGTRRLPLTLPMLLLRPATALLFGWWFWPPVSRFFVDRFFVPEVAAVDGVLRQFHFRPARLRDTMAHLHRPGMRRRLFRR